MVIHNRFKIGQTVYFATDEMQLEYIVVAVVVYSDCVRYKVAHAADNETECKEIEIIETKIIK